MENVIPFINNSEVNEDNILQVLEIVLFKSDKVMSITRLSNLLNLEKEELKLHLHRLRSKLTSNNNGFKLIINEDKITITIKEEYEGVFKNIEQKHEDKILSVVDEFLYILDMRGRAKSTINNYRLTLESFILFTNKFVEDIDYKDIRDFLIKQKEQGNENNTISTKLSIISSMFIWLKKEGVVNNNPVDRVEKPKSKEKETEYLTLEEIEEIRQLDIKLIDKVLFETLYSSGIRVSEAVNLNWDNIDLVEKTLRVIDGKGGKNRTTFISTRASILLKKYKEKYNLIEGAVFISPRTNNRYSRSSIYRRIKNIGKISNIEKDIYPHILRHSIASHLLQKGLKIDMVQELLGHTKLQTTRHYAKSDQDNIKFYYKKVLT